MFFCSRREKSHYLQGVAVTRNNRIFCATICFHESLHSQHCSPTRKNKTNLKIEQKMQELRSARFQDSNFEGKSYLLPQRPVGLRANT